LSRHCPQQGISQDLSPLGVVDKMIKMGELRPSSLVEATGALLTYHIN